MADILPNAITNRVPAAAPLNVLGQPPREHESSSCEARIATRSIRPFDSTTSTIAADLPARWADRRDGIGGRDVSFGSASFTIRPGTSVAVASARTTTGIVPSRACRRHSNSRLRLMP